MSNVLDAVPSDSREIIVRELNWRDPALLRALQENEKPTTAQSDAVAANLFDALSENFGPGHVPNEYGLVVERAIGVYFDTWPVDRGVSEKAS